MTSPFDSPTPILYRLSVEIFRLSLTVQKLFACIDLGGNIWHPGSKIWGFRGIFAPKYNFVSTRPPKGTSLQQAASFELLCMEIGSAVWAVEAYKNKKR
jgi:hypothetical protein